MRRDWEHENESKNFGIFKRRHCVNMAVEGSAEVSSKDMKVEDLNEFSNIFSAQFNNSDIHDRVLCFEIIRDEESDSSDDELFPVGSENETASSLKFWRMSNYGSPQHEMDKKSERDGKHIGGRTGAIAVEFSLYGRPLLLLSAIAAGLGKGLQQFASNH